ncbi:MAG: YlbF family regulator [Halanaerobiales bacterium]|nr:YlbF family regulator [Halanaerobiales bacterium]
MIAKKIIAKEFANKLKKTEPFQSLEKIAKKLDSDEEAQKLLNKFTEIQKTCQQKQAKGELEQKDLQKLRQIRTELNQNKTIKKYYKVNNKAAAVCKQSFLKLSELMNMDLQKYVGGGGCC